MPVPTIVIAEDDPVLRDLYVRKFTNEGFAVWTVRDGDEAIALLKAKKPNLMLCDIRMNRVDGFEVLKCFPKARRTFPIIMLTNFGESEMRSKALNLGADDFFVKKDMTIASLVELARKLLKSPESRSNPG